VRTHPGPCVGWGECHRWAPNVYPLADDGRVAVYVMEVPSERADDAWWGASACPERAITVLGPPEDYWFERLRHRHEQVSRRTIDDEEQP
jgi:ferredoxin